MPPVDLSGGLLADELRDQPFSALADPTVRVYPRHSLANLLQRPRPRLGVRVIRIRRNAVHIQYRYLRQAKIPRVTLETCPRICSVEELRNQRTGPEARAALKEGAALVEHGHRKLLGLSGKDPVGLLAAILSNEIPAQPDLGVYGLLLDAKGRVQTDLRILKRGSADLIAEVEPEGEQAAREILGRYAPFSRVEVEDLSGQSWSVLGLYGPGAKGALAKLPGDVPDLEEHQTVEVTPQGSDAPLLVAGVRRPVAGYDLIGPENALATARESLMNNGAIPADAAAYEAARIETGVPRFGSDLTPDNFPAEAGILDHAVSFSKGCYPGQETVARMHYRGHPNRTLYRLRVQGAPQPPTQITQNGKEVGLLTSLSPLGDGAALGYLHRKTDPGGELYAGEASVSILGPAEE